MGAGAARMLGGDSTLQGDKLEMIRARVRVGGGGQKEDATGGGRLPILLHERPRSEHSSRPRSVLAGPLCKGARSTVHRYRGKSQDDAGPDRTAVGIELSLRLGTVFFPVDDVYLRSIARTAAGPWTKSLAVHTFGLLRPTVCGQRLARVVFARLAPSEHATVTVLSGGDVEPDSSGYGALDRASHRNSGPCVASLLAEERAARWLKADGIVAIVAAHFAARGGSGSLGPPSIRTARWGAVDFLKLLGAGVAMAWYIVALRCLATTTSIKPDYTILQKTGALSH
ncbi:hypothetical protein C8R44DRAFT_728556 [Mycena epipterygia]|nr:hypothetical protein C8R44DRAFT_728556 [Mycena epipterygia]